MSFVDRFILGPPPTKARARGGAIASFTGLVVSLVLLLVQSVTILVGRDPNLAQLASMLIWAVVAILNGVLWLHYQRLYHGLGA